MNNYFNPQAAKPNIGDLAQGPLGGFQYGQDRQQYQQLMGLQQMMMQMEKQKQEEELVRGLAMREAERKAKTSGFNLEDLVNTESAQIPGYGRSVGLGNVGKAQQEQAKGALALGTVGTQTDMTNMQNRVSTMISGARELELIAATSPMMAEGQYQKYKQTLPPQVAQILPPNYTPEVPSMIKAISDRVMHSPEHRREIDKTNVKGNWDMDLQRERNKGALDVAREGTRRAELTAQQKAHVQKLEAKLAQIVDKITNGTATPHDIEMAKYIQQVMMQIKAAGQAGQMDSTALMLMLMREGGALPPNGPNPRRGTPAPTEPPRLGDTPKPPISDDPLGILR